MRVVNVHERTYAAPAERLAELIETLGSRQDRLWPRRWWPPMVLEDGLSSGSRGGHGPVRYVVESHEAGRGVVFRFTRPRGWAGTHAFTVGATEDGRTRLRHELRMDARGAGLMLWAGVLRPLHDAVIEDALHRAATELGLAGGPPPRWSWYVRFLRWALNPRRRAGTGR